MRDRLRTILASVARGIPITITRRGAPVAEIHPVGTAEALKKGT